MSSFTALNLNSNDNSDESKDHSRELQIEESSKVFQAALSHLKAKRFDEAKLKFDQLFDIKVIKPNRWGLYDYSSPTLDSLRYLAYRNRGVMYYQYVKEYFRDLDAGDIVDYILKTLENLLEALQHGDGDSTVTNILVFIFESFKSKKLSRSILEHELTKFPEEPELLSSLAAMFREQKQVLKKYSNLLDILNSNSLDTNVPENLTRLIQYIESSDMKIDEPNDVLRLIKDMKSEDDEMVRALDGLDIAITEVSWEEIAIAMRGVLPKYKVLNALGKIPDSYGEADGPIEYITFEVQHNNENKNDPSNEMSSESNQDQFGKTTDGFQIHQSGGSDASVDKKTNDQPLNETKRNDSEERPTQRSSKRFKEKENPQENDAELLINFHTEFIEELRSLLSSVDLETDISLKNIDPDASDSKIPLFMSDFYDCLSSWTNKHTEFLKQGQAQNSNSSKGAPDDFTQLTMLLRSSMLFGDVEPTASLTEVEEKDVLAFIKEVNEKRLHFHAARLLFLKHMLSQGSDGKCLIIDYFWSPSLYETVEIFSLGMETSLFEVVETTTDISLISLAISIFEILVNLFGTFYNEILSKKSQGQKITDLENQKNKLERKILRWYHMLLNKDLSEEFSFRFEWVHFCYLQYIADITSPDILTTMENIEKGLANKVHFDTITFSNYANIPSLSIRTVKSQFSKIKMLRRFTIIETDDGKDSSNFDHVENLYCILNNFEASGSDYSAMLDFVDSSPFIMKLKLWRMVMNQYASMKDHIKFQICYFNVLKFLHQRLESNDYREQSQLQRQQTLLSIFRHIGEFSNQFFSLISEDWVVAETANTSEDAKILVSIFTSLYPLVFYESLVERDNNLKSFFKKAVKSSNILKDIFLSIISLLIIYYSRVVKRKFESSEKADSYVIRIISLFHTLAGKFRMCDSFQRNFLKVLEEILCQIFNDESFMQLKLVLWCRYHITVGAENSEQQHVTKECPMGRDNAIVLSNYLIKLQYEDRNPLILNTGRSSFKLFFETVMNIVGDVEFESNHVLSRNQFFFEQYFKAPITIKSVRDAYAGNLDLEFTSPNDEIQVGVNGGLFYVFAVHALNQYKSRKKLMQARPSELDAIISTLKTDILYNTKRFETWFLLGRCYSYVVEDDLTWTSDKLTSKDKKQATAFSEKRAILCYLMSLSLYFSQDVSLLSENIKEDRQLVFRDLLEALGEEMLQAYLKPMNCMSYIYKPKSLLRLKEDGKIENVELSEKASISATNIRRCILIVLAKADALYSLETRNWINPFYIAKLHLKEDPSLFKTSGIALLRDACRLSMHQLPSSSGEQVLESHYMLVSSCYKCFKRKIFTIEEALQHLKSDNEFFERSDIEWQVTKRDDFYSLIIELLKVILSKDKKKWHHRPTYRIAQIKYNEFGDIDGAMEEMSKLLALKSVNKNVVNIWKPDHERPGKHFVYAYQYVMFYMNLLKEKNDYMPIGWMIKKLRRFGSGMIKSSEAINRAAEFFVQGAKSDLTLNEKEDSELMMQSIPFPEFVKRSEELFEHFNKENYDSNVIDVFSLAYNLKKGTNSIQFDVVCITIYFKFFYSPFVRDSKTLIKNEFQIVDSSSATQNGTPGPPHSASPASPDFKQTKLMGKNPSAVRKRVSKKDVFDRINKLIEKKLDQEK